MSQNLNRFPSEFYNVMVVNAKVGKCKVVPAPK